MKQTVGDNVISRAPSRNRLELGLPLDLPSQVLFRCSSSPQIGFPERDSLMHNLHLNPHLRLHLWEPELRKWGSSNATPCSLLQSLPFRDSVSYKSRVVGSSWRRILRAAGLIFLGFIHLMTLLSKTMPSLPEYHSPSCYTLKTGLSCPKNILHEGRLSVTAGWWSRRMV